MNGRHVSHARGRCRTGKTRAISHGKLNGRLLLIKRRDGIARFREMLSDAMKRATKRRARSGALFRPGRFYATMRSVSRISVSGAIHRRRSSRYFLSRLSSLSLQEHV